MVFGFLRGQKGGKKAVFWIGFLAGDLVGVMTLILVAVMASKRK
nr:MAG TPA: hypothetical protein [Caudoviricetes sp.]